jgi:hypothetical protein
MQTDARVMLLVFSSVTYSGFTIHMDVARTDDTRLGNRAAEMNTSLDVTCLLLSNDTANKTTSSYVCEKLFKTMLKVL